MTKRPIDHASPAAAGHASARASLKLTFHLDYSVAANQSHISRNGKVAEGFRTQAAQAELIAEVIRVCSLRARVGPGLRLTLERKHLIIRQLC
jgi:hypothetical protein